MPPYSDESTTPAPAAPQVDDRLLKILRHLLDEDAITQDEVESAVEQGTRTGESPLKILNESKKITSAQLIKATCAASKIPFLELVEYDVDPSAAALLNGDYAKRETLLPVGFDNGKLIIAVQYTTLRNNHIRLRDDLSRMTGEQVDFAVALREDLVGKINRTYRAESEIAELATSLAAEDAANDSDVPAEAAAEDEKIAVLVQRLLSQAIDDGASDIHIDPGEHHIGVRFRVDGVCHEITTFERAISKRLVARLKIMCDMDISEKRKPQDGRLSTIHKGRKIDLRVAALPTVHGVEKVVMRILDNSTAQMALSDLGFEPANMERFRQSYIKPYGMILVTGPTGSGKSTTLYATLNVVSNPKVNVITVEDPVEYRIPGINQVQVNAKAGLTFASALKSILRSDPDIVLLGEIRDKETAQIAVEAALTGHLVLSTLHTNDAPQAVTRLTEMGIEPFLVGSALDAVLAQRLCQRLCSKCKEEYVPEPEELTNLPKFPWTPGDDLPTIYRAKVGGCNLCSNRGYKGRMGLHEVMSVTEEIQRLASRNASAEEIGRVAVEQGMSTLVEDGWAKVLQGKTSIEEVLRVVAT